jgi:hypothetical protein
MPTEGFGKRDDFARKAPNSIARRALGFGFGGKNCRLPIR